MKRFLTILGLLAVLAACDPVKYFNKEDDREKDEAEQPRTACFAKGADISWITEMESKGYKFYAPSGREMECTTLLKESGFDAVRLRVWVNPDPQWCSKEDVLVKARRAKALGMDIMIDFHYSDWWADPGKQNVPAAWKDYTPDQMAGAVASHTGEVLRLLKDNKIDVKWVQIGNEVENGMLWESGRVSGQDATNFVKYFNAGAAAAKEMYPNAEVILHISNAWKLETLIWFYDLVGRNGADYDIIGLSLYPSYWQDGAYPDWRGRTAQAVSNISQIHLRYSRPVMLVEFGMPASEPAKAKEALQYLIDSTRALDWFRGIFLWEPESEKDRNGYEYGAFSNGTPTIALDPFNN